MSNRIFGNRYQVTEKIGMGGMAEVFKATDSTLGRTVALKVMLPQYAADANFAARFRQEAQAAANLNSPYIVNIYDWGRDEDSYYIVMEYVRGTDLKTAIQQRGHIHPRKVAEIGSQVCSALSVAHGYDIIHRDIKSANIMVQADGNVKVMDFGIAQAGRPGMTQDSSVLGTAHYVSPEQAQGKRLTAASDLYSLGVVMYEAATGQLPFDGPDVVSVAMKQVNEIPVPPREINPDIDPRFEQIILRSLEKNPENRYATANEMKRAIDDYLKGRTAPVGADPTMIIDQGGYSDTDVYAPGHTTVMPGAAATTVVAGAGKTQVVQPAEQQRKQQQAIAPKDRNSKKNTKNDNKGGGKKKAVIAIVIVLVLLAALAGVAVSQGWIGVTKVSVPSVEGMTQEQAVDTLEKSGLSVGDIKLEKSEEVEEGHVISQDPAAEEMVAEKTKVNLVVSSGKGAAEMVKVPNLNGLTAAEAERSLSDCGLKGISKQAPSDSFEAGKVFEQDPLPQTMVEEGSTVTYTISTGEEVKTFTVSNYAGIPEDQARATLEGAGLIVECKYEPSDVAVGDGSVCAQSIAPNTTVTTGTKIVLTIKQGNATVTVPGVVGYDEANATSTLEAAGFSVVVEYASGTQGQCINQSPAANTTGKAGDTVTITIGTGD